MPSILVVDIGNTSTSVALYTGRRVSKHHHIPGGVRRQMDVREVVRAVAGKTRPAGCAIASVVPTANDAWIKALKRLKVQPLLVHHRLRLGVGVDYPKPTTIGADRLANACAARDLFGAPVIVADFGTAVTFDVVSREGKYIGGVIAPGLSMMTDYLAEKTALLPRVELRGRCPGVGRSTAGAMRIGARVGYRGMVIEIVKHLKEAMEETDVALCATGGFARWALQGTDMPFHFRPDLTLYGVGRIYELNA
jgi:type III pantothenate kinase